MRANMCSTTEVLEARGARTRRVLEDDLHAGLFDDLLPRRTSGGKSSAGGVWLVWPLGSLRRAREIRRGLEKYRTREALARAWIERDERDG